MLSFTGWSLEAVLLLFVNTFGTFLGIRTFNIQQTGFESSFQVFILVFIDKNSLSAIAGQCFLLTDIQKIFCLFLFTQFGKIFFSFTLELDWSSKTFISQR